MDHESLLSNRSNYYCDVVLNEAKLINSVTEKAEYLCCLLSNINCQILLCEMVFVYWETLDTINNSGWLRKENREILFRYWYIIKKWFIFYSGKCIFCAWQLRACAASLNEFIFAWSEVFFIDFLKQSKLNVLERGKIAICLARFSSRSFEKMHMAFVHLLCAWIKVSNIQSQNTHTHTCAQIYIQAFIGSYGHKCIHKHQHIYEFWSEIFTV